MVTEILQALRAAPPADAGRHRVVLTVLLLAVPGLSIAGFVRGWSIPHVLAEVVLPVLGAWAIGRHARHRRVATATAAIGLMYVSAVLVHVADGVTEAHFAFFVAFGLVALYRDWLVFFAAAGVAVGHHAVFALTDGVLLREPYQLEDPWLWAGIHVAFVTVVTGVQALGMLDVSRSVRRRTAAEAELARSEERRRTALTLHDDVVQALATANYARQLLEPELSDGPSSGRWRRRGTWSASCSTAT